MEDLPDDYGNIDESITDYNWKEERGTNPSGTQFPTGF